MSFPFYLLNDNICIWLKWWTNQKPTHTHTHKSVMFFFWFQRISAMEKGQCPTVATWEGGNVRSRKATPTTATTPGQVKDLFIVHFNSAVWIFHSVFILYLIFSLRLSDFPFSLSSFLSSLAAHSSVPAASAISLNIEYVNGEWFNVFMKTHTHCWPCELWNRQNAIVCLTSKMHPWLNIWCHISIICRWWGGLRLHSGRNTVGVGDGRRSSHYHG